MIDLHTHTTFSDGELIPAELARRARVAGYQALAMTDHGDLSNVALIVENVRRLTRSYSAFAGIDLFAGIELTHVPPALIGQSVELAREAGAEVVVVHGETIVEPVETGTNLAGIDAGCDVLAHPGLLTDTDAALAAAKGVLLEITTRRGHSLANGHVLAMARKHGCGLVINNDAHAPSDLVSREMRRMIGLGCGMTSAEIAASEDNARRLLDRAARKG